MSSNVARVDKPASDNVSTASSPHGRPDHTQSHDMEYPQPHKSFGQSIHDIAEAIGVLLGALGAFLGSVLAFVALYKKFKRKLSRLLRDPGVGGMPWMSPNHHQHAGPRGLEYERDRNEVPKANEVMCSWIESHAMTGRGTYSKVNLAYGILVTTKGFDEECLMSEGLTGQVYRGHFPGGKLLAIKKINMVELSLSEQDKLVDMLLNMSRLKHPNISSIIGYCVDSEHCVLLYEYAENASLEDLMFSSATRSRALSWKARMKIACRVASALEYMHLTCSPAFAHGNIKATNILLDAQLMPYLRECGFARLSHFLSNRRKDVLRGTKGYAAPELISTGREDIKADLYSFGVILLVLLTGKKAFDSSRRQNEQFLVDWASPHLHELGSLERITDPRILASALPEAISAFGAIISLCIKQSPDSRPPVTIIREKLDMFVQPKGSAKCKSNN